MGAIEAKVFLFAAFAPHPLHTCKGSVRFGGPGIGEGARAQAMARLVEQPTGLFQSLRNLRAGRPASFASSTLCQNRESPRGGLLDSLEKKAEALLLGALHLSGLHAGGAHVGATDMALRVANGDLLDVGTEHAVAHTVRVADATTSNRCLTADLAYFGHS